MARKTILSIGLIILGVSIGLLVILAYSMSGGKISIALPFLAAAIIFIIAGSILAFSRLLDRLVNPLLDELHKDFEDDIQDLKQRRLTNTAWMVILTGIAAIAFSFFVFRLHKLEAMWGAIPVAVPTLIAMAALAWFIPRTHWFRDFGQYTPVGIFIVPTVGLIFTLLVGITRTENLTVLQATRQEVIEYNTPPTVSFQQAVGIGELGLYLNVPSCDGEECLVFMVIALVVLTFILVIGSAFIPHFWLFSGSILLGIMALIAIHDLRVRRPDEKQN